MHRPKARICTWTKEQTCVLIEEIQKYPLLWDSTNRLYQHRSKRFEALRKIIEKLKPIKPNVNEAMISRKLAVLKHQYNSEQKRIEDPPEHLLDKHGNYQPSLWCFDMMRFLDSEIRFPIKRKRRDIEEIKKQEKSNHDDDFNTEEESSESNDPFEEVEIERVEPEAEKIPKKYNPDRDVLRNQCMKLVKSLSNGLKNIDDQKNIPVAQIQQSPKTFLGLMVESELSAVSADVYHDAKWKIMRILEEAATKEHQKKMRNTNSPATNSTSTVISNPSPVEESKVIARDSGIFKTPAGRNIQIVAMNPDTFDKYIIQQ